MTMMICFCQFQPLAPRLVIPAGLNGRPARIVSFPTPTVSRVQVGAQVLSSSPVVTIRRTSNIVERKGGMSTRQKSRPAPPPTIIDVTEDDGSPTTSGEKRKPSTDGMDCSASEQDAYSPVKKQMKLDVEAEVMFSYPPLPERGRIMMHKWDKKCLNEVEFLNDTIVDFYLR